MDIKNRIFAMLNYVDIFEYITGPDSEYKTANSTEKLEQ